MDLPTVNPGEIIKSAHINEITSGLEGLESLILNHAAQHGVDGPDPITPASIGAYTKTEVDAMVGSATPSNGSNVLVQPGASDATVFPNGVDVIFT